MEDQQPRAGDLTTESSGLRSGDGAFADTDVADVDVAVTESQRTAAEPTTDSAGGDEINSSAAEETEDAEDADITGETETAPRQRRPAGAWSMTAAAVAALLFVGAAAFAGATVQPYLIDRATAATKASIARTAANAIATLWTYNPQNVDKLADRAAQYLSGDFGASYRKYIDAIAAPNKQAQITNTTEVIGAAVESLTGPDATAIVYTDTTSSSPATKGVPALKYLSYRLAMKRDKARWLVTKMTTITSLDLTPKF